MNFFNNKVDKNIRDKSLNIKLTEEEHRELKIIADSLGISLSALVRTVVYSGLERVRKSNNPRSFIEKEG